MRVLSKLAQIDFRFGKIKRNKNLLVVESSPDSKMPSTVYISPQDIVEVLKRMLVSPGAILFVLALPYFLYRWNRSDRSIHQGTRNKREWPTI
jgi:preprotein translocase subunit Sec63